MTKHCGRECKNEPNKYSTFLQCWYGCRGSGLRLVLHWKASCCDCDTVTISPTEEIAGTQNDPCTPKASNFYHGRPSVTDWTKKQYRVPKTTRYFDRSPIYHIHIINDDGQTCSHVLLAQCATTRCVSQILPSSKTTINHHSSCWLKAKELTCLLMLADLNFELTFSIAMKDITMAVSCFWIATNKKIGLTENRKCIRLQSWKILLGRKATIRAEAWIWYKQIDNNCCKQFEAKYVSIRRSSIDQLGWMIEWAHHFQVECVMWIGNWWFA